MTDWTLDANFTALSGCAVAGGSVALSDLLADAFGDSVLNTTLWQTVDTTGTGQFNENTERLEIKGGGAWDATGIYAKTALAQATRDACIWTGYIFRYQVYGVNTVAGIARGTCIGFEIGSSGQIYLHDGAGGTENVGSLTIGGTYYFRFAYTEAGDKIDCWIKGGAEYADWTLLGSPAVAGDVYPCVQALNATNPAYVADFVSRCGLGEFTVHDSGQTYLDAGDSRSWSMDTFAADTTGTLSNLSARYACNDTGADPTYPDDYSAWLDFDNGETDDFVDEANGGCRYMWLRLRLYGAGLSLSLDAVSADSYNTDLTPPGTPTLAEIVSTGATGNGVRVDWTEPGDADYAYSYAQVDVNGGGWTLFNDQAALAAGTAMKFNRSLAGTETEAAGYRYEKHLSLMGTLQAGDTVQVRVRAVDIHDNESDWSTSDLITLSSPGRPDAPVISSVESADGTLTLTLTAGSETDVLYAHYRRVTESAWSAESASFSRTGSGEIAVTGLTNREGYRLIAYAKSGGLYSKASDSAAGVPDDGAGPLSRQVRDAVAAEITDATLPAYVTDPSTGDESDTVWIAQEGLAPVWQENQATPAVYVLSSTSGREARPSGVLVVKVRVLVCLVQLVQTQNQSDNVEQTREALLSLLTGRRLTAWPELVSATSDPTPTAEDFEKLGKVGEFVSMLALEFELRRART